MKNFTYFSPANLARALDLLAAESEQTAILAGGTDLLGEMKEGILGPQRVMNLKAVEDLHYIEPDQSGLRIGALAKISEVAKHTRVRRTYVALAQAAESVATPQIRNMGTVGGNLCQRPRCWYYRSHDFPCLKKGGDVCYAYEGENKYHAILGGGPCYIVHPSDLAPALMAFDATIKLESPGRSRALSLDKFYALPEKQVERENVLGPDEIVSEVTLPGLPHGTKSVYLKVRERESFDFALVSLAMRVRLEMGVCREVSVVFGGLAPVPWRSREAERVLQGRRLTEARAKRAADAALAGTDPLAQNGYKVILAGNLMLRAARVLAAK